MYTIYINEFPDIVIEDNCQDPAHRKGDSLFPTNCKHCRSLPCYADDATISISTRTRKISQEKIIKIMDRVKSYLNSQELIVNMSKKNVLENMVKQKRTISKEKNKVKIPLMTEEKIRKLHQISTLDF